MVKMSESKYLANGNGLDERPHLFKSVIKSKRASESTNAVIKTDNNANMVQDFINGNDLEDISLPFKADDQRKEATDATKTAIESSVSMLNFSNTDDFGNARKDPAGGNSFDDPPVVHKGNDPRRLKVWDVTPYTAFLTGKPTEDETTIPDTVNPSLWRNANLCVNFGIFTVVENQVYQIRGYDISNMTFVRSDNGWIVFDPLRGVETAVKAFELFQEKISTDPVKGIVFSHSHVDHFGGVRAILDANSETADSIPIYAPAEFTDHAVSENVIAGNAMGRRSLYQYGNLLTNDTKGAINIGLGISVSTAATSFALPTNVITVTTPEDDPINCDGVDMLFQLTPGTEAPSEMNTFFPEHNWLWMAENATNTMHNVLTLRGAQVRDALKWATYMQETIDMYGRKAIVKFQAHHWPIWKEEGKDNIVEYLEKQRDLYKYTHDQSVRLMNKGYIGSEISEMIKFPPSLDEEFSIRGYYGTLRHNSRAVYQYYMGWYTSNPSDLNNLPPVEAAKKYVEYMGTVDQILDKAKNDYDAGNYRWVAEVLKHVVFAYPDNADAKSMLADAYEQLGYQAECGPWRNEYLTGAQEVRAGVPKILNLTQVTFSRDFVENMRTTDILNFISISLNAEKAYQNGQDLTFCFQFTYDPTATDTSARKYYLTLTNCTLNYTTVAPTTNIDLHVKMNQLTFNLLLTGLISEEDIVENPDIYFFKVISGDVDYLDQLFDMLDDFKLGFPIVGPREITPMEFNGSPSGLEDLKKLVPSAPSFSHLSTKNKNVKQSGSISKQMNGMSLECGPGAC